VTAEPAFAARCFAPAIEALEALDEDGFRRLFRGSPVARAGFRRFQDRVAVARANARR
jgi:epoxyqueuosine reductase QueG